MFDRLNRIARRHYWVALVYPLGDALAQLILGTVDGSRVLWLALAAFTFYNFEIPRWFEILHTLHFSAVSLQRRPWLKLLVRNGDGRLNAGGKTLGAILYFNPLWIARHYLFLRLSVYQWGALGNGQLWIGLLQDGTKSFVSMLPLTVVGNYIVQEKIPLPHRFLASAVMSGVMAMLYALVMVLWSH